MESTKSKTTSVVFPNCSFAILFISNIKIVPQAHAYVIERLGAYSATWNVGLHLKIPFIERVAKYVSLKEQVVDFAPQPVITKDNVDKAISILKEVI